MHCHLLALERETVGLLVPIEGYRWGEQILFDEWADLADAAAEDAGRGHDELGLLGQEIGG